MDVIQKTGRIRWGKKIMEKHEALLEIAGWVTICFSILYFSGHLIVALTR
jgi:hypothetical protein